MKALLGAAACAALIGTPALAADMAVKPPPASPAQVFSWTGFYVGGNLGYGWGSAANTVTFVDANFPLAFASSSRNNLQTVIGGGQIGYNWQFSPHGVFGVEADLQDFNKQASRNFSGACTIICVPNSDIVNGTSNAQVSWFGTVRGRLGYAANDLFFYGAAGLAFGEVKLSGTVNEATVLGGGGWNITSPYGIAKDKAGWTVGAGTEGIISKSWSWKIEYLYLDLGSISTSETLPPLPGISISAQSHFTANVLRVGLNYRLN